jgi:hypothetical protein
MSSIVTTLFEMELEMETSNPGRERYNRRVKFEDALDRAVTPLRWYISSCCDYCFSCICEFAGVDKYKKEREENYRRHREWLMELNRAEEYLKFVVMESDWERECKERKRSKREADIGSIMTRSHMNIGFIEEKLDEKKGEGIIIVKYGEDNPRRVQIYSDERGEA